MPIAFIQEHIILENGILELVKRRITYMSIKEQFPGPDSIVDNKVKGLSKAIKLSLTENNVFNMMLKYDVKIGDPNEKLESIYLPIHDKYTSWNLANDFKTTYLLLKDVSESPLEDSINQFFGRMTMLRIYFNQHMFVNNRIAFAKTDDEKVECIMDRLKNIYIIK